MSGGRLGVRDPIADYVRRWGVREDPVLERCRQETASDPRRGMQIEPEQGALMQTLILALRPRLAVEVGVFTGYSSTATATAMQRVHGEAARLYACDVSEAFVERARAYWRAAGVEDVIEARLGPAAETLTALLGEGLAGKVDFMFIDADKPNYHAYYQLGLDLLRPGGLMLIDNMLWSGLVADPQDVTPETQALRDLAKVIHADERVDMTLATVGDGLSVIAKR
ncbi:MAG: O-methyltransferase [Caulobacterales bacterium]